MLAAKTWSAPSLCVFPSGTIIVLVWRSHTRSTCFALYERVCEIIPRFVVLNATVKNAASLASDTFFIADIELYTAAVPSSESLVPVSPRHLLSSVASL